MRILIDSVRLKRPLETEYKLTSPPGRLSTKELTPMRILPRHPLRAAAVTVGLTGLFSLAAQAHHYRLESATPAAPFLRDGRADLVIEPSGVAPLGDGRRVLVADDKAGVLYVVDVCHRRTVGARLGSSKLPPATGAGPNWEGMASRLGGELLSGRLAAPARVTRSRAASSMVVRFRLRSGEPSRHRR